MNTEAETRVEQDSMGTIRVPADRYWGAQTQRSVEHFPIGVGLDTMPAEIIHAFGLLKLAAARVNHALCPDRMDAEKLAVIERAAREVADGALDAHFPLVVWQTGSGTHTNMNANEVIANRANELAGKALCHPNDDVNMSQSSNDCFPTAMRISAVTMLEQRLLPAVFSGAGRGASQAGARAAAGDRPGRYGGRHRAERAGRLCAAGRGGALASFRHGISARAEFFPCADLAG